jgi:hypothetical protein
MVFASKVQATRVLLINERQDPEKYMVVFCTTSTGGQTATTIKPGSCKDLEDIASLKVFTPRGIRSIAVFSPLARGLIPEVPLTNLKYAIVRVTDTPTSTSTYSVEVKSIGSLAGFWAYKGQCKVEEIAEQIGGQLLPEEQEEEGGAHPGASPAKTATQKQQQEARRRREEQIRKKYGL